MSPSAGAEVEPPTPRERVIRLVIRTLGRTTEPEVPVQVCGHGQHVDRTLRRLLPPVACPVAPAMHLAHRTDGTGLNPLARQPQSFARVPVVTHLRDKAGFLGDLCHHACFFDAVSHRLLDIDVLARPQRRQRDGACMWSGVATITASMSFRFSNITR